MIVSTRRRLTLKVDKDVVLEGGIPVQIQQAEKTAHGGGGFYLVAVLFGGYTHSFQLGVCLLSGEIKLKCIKTQ